LKGEIDATEPGNGQQNGGGRAKTGKRAVIVQSTGSSFKKKKKKKTSTVGTTFKIHRKRGGFSRAGGKVSQNQASSQKKKPSRGEILTNKNMSGGGIEKICNNC